MQKSAAKPPRETPEFVVIGRITRAHGLLGQVQVSFETDDPQRFLRVERIFLGDSAFPVGVRNVRLHQNGAILTLIGIEDRTAAETLRGQWIKIPRAEALPLNNDEYFVHQIVGLSVETTNGIAIGAITDVLETGANDVYVVQTEQGELLLPAVDTVIREINLEEQRVVVDLPPGLTSTKIA